VKSPGLRTKAALIARRIAKCLRIVLPPPSPRCQQSLLFRSQFSPESDTKNQTQRCRQLYV